MSYGRISQSGRESSGPDIANPSYQASFSENRSLAAWGACFSPLPEYPGGYAQKEISA